MAKRENLPFAVPLYCVLWFLLAFGGGSSDVVIATLLPCDDVTSLAAAPAAQRPAPLSPLVVIDVDLYDSTVELQHCRFRDFSLNVTSIGRKNNLGISLVNTSLQDGSIVLWAPQGTGSITVNVA